MPSALDPSTLQAVMARVELRLSELSRRTGHCALCRSAELKAVSAELRGLVAQATPRAPLSAAESP